MIFRITEHVKHGTIDNRKRGTTKLTLHLEGVQEPVSFLLQGDCLQDLAGCVTEFENLTPKPIPGNPGPLPPLTHGVIGDMTGTRRVPNKTTNAVDNVLYLEWFTNQHEMLLIESTKYRINVSLPAWEMDDCDEQVQLMTNQQMYRSVVKEWTKRYASMDEDGHLPDHHWDTRLREAEGIAIAYQEVFQKYKHAPMGDISIAFIMGWDDVLDDLAVSEEQGTPCACANSDMLSLFDILTDEEAQEIQSCMDTPLFKQVIELTELCQSCFQKEINTSQRKKTEPPAPVAQIFYSIRYITPRILSALLQEKEHHADYTTMAARMAMCIEQLRRSNSAIKESRIPIDDDVKEGFISLLEEVNAFRESLVTQSKKSNH